MSKKWDRRFIDLARHIAQWSKDPSTKVGCIVVGPDREIRSTGFNGFPRGIDDSAERLNDRALKYPLVCHAEENAIMHAARTGISLKDCSAYVTWPPCTRCARSLVQAGVKRSMSSTDVLVVGGAVFVDQSDPEVIQRAVRALQAADGIGACLEVAEVAGRSVWKVLLGLENSSSRERRRRRDVKRSGAHTLLVRL